MNLTVCYKDFSLSVYGEGKFLTSLDGPKILGSIGIQ